MPRPLRIEYENAWYHVMNRGANYQNIFLTNEHKELFFKLIEETCNDYKIEIHSYCLMNNHYHLLVRTPFANLGRAMRHLNGVYTLKFNKIEKRDGSLFRGRYKAIIIEKEDYLLQVSRYIHLNPLNAKICGELSNFSWSSYKAFSGLVKKPAWLNTTIILNYFDTNENYIKFIKEGNNIEVENFYNKPSISTILGSHQFKKNLLEDIDDQKRCSSAADFNRVNFKPSIETIIQITIKFFGSHYDAVKNSKRGKRNLVRMVAMYLARRLGMLKYNEIAEYFTCISVDGVASAISRCEQILENDICLRDKVNNLIMQITEVLHKAHT